MNIGTFSKNEAGVIVGKIVSPFGIMDGVAFEKIEGKNGTFYSLTVDGGELGTANIETSKGGNQYLDVVLRSPFIPGHVAYAALVESQKAPGNFALLWNPPKKKTEAKADEAQAEASPF